MLIEQLTPREFEVLTALAGGGDGRSLAQRLGISPNTVRTHVQNIMLKLGVHSRMEAISFARRLGVLSAPRHGADGRPGGAPDVRPAVRPLPHSGRG